MKKFSIIPLFKRGTLIDIDKNTTTKVGGGVYFTPFRFEFYAAEGFRKGEIIILNFKFEWDY